MPRRAALLGDLSGDVLEIGAGTGLNLKHYPMGARKLVLTEPNPGMLRRLRRRAPVSVRVEQAAAESLGLPDESFDVVVSTFVLCTAHEPASALAEVVRVLRPGGHLVLWSTCCRTRHARRAPAAASRQALGVVRRRLATRRSTSRSRSVSTAGG